MNSAFCSSVNFVHVRLVTFLHTLGDTDEDRDGWMDGWTINKHNQTDTHRPQPFWLKLHMAARVVQRDGSMCWMAGAVRKLMKEQQSLKETVEMLKRALEVSHK